MTEQRDTKSVGAMLPHTFTIEKTPSQELSYKLRADDGTSHFVIGPLDSSASKHADFTLSWNNVQPARSLGIVKHTSTKDEAEVSIANSSSDTPSLRIRMKYELLGNRRAVHRFRLGPPDVNTETDFEWRNDGSGWELAMTSGPDGKRDVLATGAINAGSDQPPRFTFADAVVDDSLKDQLKLVAVISWLRVWQKIMVDLSKAANSDKNAVAAALCITM